MEPLISPTEASQRIASRLNSSETENVTLERATGRILAQTVITDRDLPPFARAMMDGIAFPSQTLDPNSFTIAGLHPAGSPPPSSLPPGQAWEIMTGAAVPADCDTVVPYEDLAPDRHSIRSPFEPGQCIHPAGSDARRGDSLLTPGQRLGPAEIAIAASVGSTRLEVFRQPRIAIVTTGDEAIPPEDQPEPWQIRRSNGPMLAALLHEQHLAPCLQLHVIDDEAATTQTLDQALAESDLVLIAGGISKGKRDLIRPLLEARLGPPAFHGVSQKPGKPLAFWPGPPAVFALPGNPVSVLATFRRYVIPALNQLQGTPHIPLAIRVPEAAPLPKLHWLLTVGRKPDGTLAPCPPRNSGDFASIAGTIGVVEIPPSPAFTPGQTFPLY